MSLQNCKTAYGDCWFYGKDEYIGRSLYNYGEWSGEECEKIIELSCGVCLDIGANIGFMSMAMLHAGHEVIAFEPQPQLFELLKRNARAARCENVALGLAAGTAKMARVRYGDKGNYGGVRLHTRSELGSIDVEVRTLDSYKLENVGFIKMDVEGYEKQVLLGAVDTLNRCSPTLYLEDDRDDLSKDLRGLLKELGYVNIEEHQPPMFRENNYAGNTKDIWAPTRYISKNIICSK